MSAAVETRAISEHRPSGTSAVSDRAYNRARTFAPVTKASNRGKSTGDHGGRGLDREGRRELVSTRWGLAPYFWKKSLKEVPATFNARAETIVEKPMFRDSFKRRRCIIPASGFFEWTDEADGKQPHLFSAADGSPILAFAGLWDRWIDPASKEEILSCIVIVSGASEWMTRYHDRMPVLLRADDFDAWLNGSLGADALRPAAESALREWPVSRLVNRTGVGDDDPTSTLRA
ncbi:MAG: SOS response-associated peptidase [Roseiarcus sp.]